MYALVCDTMRLVVLVFIGVATWRSAQFLRSLAGEVRGIRADLQVVAGVVAGTAEDAERARVAADSAEASVKTVGVWVREIRDGILQLVEKKRRSAGRFPSPSNPDVGPPSGP